MEIRLYISVMVMIAVLMVNTGLISESNCQKVQRLLGGQKGRKKKQKEMREVF